MSYSRAATLVIFGVLWAWCQPLSGQMPASFVPTKLPISNPYTANLSLANTSFTHNHLLIENKGQWDATARFLARLPGMNVWVTNTGLVYDLYRKRDGNHAQTQTKNSDTASPPALGGHVVKMQFVGAKKAALAHGTHKETPYFNYFLGNDRSKWASNVPSYSEARIDGLYEGISARVYFDSGQVRYDMIVEPGADASQITLEFDGADGVRVNKNSDLVLQTSVGELLHGKLYAYQVKNGRREQISCGFRVSGDKEKISFAVGDYDPALPLVIDPLVWGTYFGGAGNDYPMTVQIDAQQRPVIAGYLFTTSIAFPVTAGAYNPTQTPSSRQLFISKFTADVSTLVFSTFFGGTSVGDTNRIGTEYAGAATGGGLAIDGQGDILLAGSTSDNTNFPLQSAFQSMYGGGTYDAFVAKFTDGGSLVYSTYVGSSSDNEHALVTTDNQGNAYLAVRHNNTSDVPNGYSPTVIAGGVGTGRVTVVRLNSSGVVNYTFRAQANSFSPQDICVDKNGFVYIVGQVFAGYPVTPTRYSSYVSGDAFLMKINPVGAGVSDMVYSTCIGTIGGEYHVALDVDDNGRCYLAGRTESTSFPTTPNAFQSIFGGGGNDGFLAVIDPNIAGTAGLIYGTYFGVNENDRVFDVKVGKDGTICLLGDKANIAITTPGAMFTTNRGGEDIFYAQMDIRRSGKAQLLYSTIIGGAAGDEGRNLALDNTGRPVITGFTTSTNFPTSPTAFQRTRRGGNDGFLLKLQPTPEFPLRTGFASGIEFSGGTARTQRSFAVPLRWTMEAWVLSPQPPQGNGNRFVVTHGNNGFVWDHFTAGTRGGFQTQLSGVFYTLGFGTLEANIWYHLAASYDGTVLRTYRNGILVDQRQAIGIPTPASGQMFFAGGGFQGTIDEVRYWNAALPDTVIRRFMGQEVDNTHPQWSNLLGYWKFNDYDGLLTPDDASAKNTVELVDTFGDAVVPATQEYTVFLSPRATSVIRPRILPSVGQSSSLSPVALVLPRQNGASALASVRVSGQELLYTPTNPIPEGFSDRITYRLGQAADTVNSTINLRFVPEAQGGTAFGLPNTATPMPSGTYRLYGGTAPFVYAWSPSVGLSSTTASLPTFTLATNSTYTLTITDALGFRTTTTVSVNVTGPFYYISGDAGERSSWNIAPDGVGVAPLSLSIPSEFIVPRNKLATLRSAWTLTSGATLMIQTGASFSVQRGASLRNGGSVQVGGNVTLENNGSITGNPVRWLAGEAVLTYSGTEPSVATSVELPSPMSTASVVIDNSGGVRLSRSTTILSPFTLRAGAVLNTSGATLRLGGSITLFGRFADDAVGSLVIEGTGSVQGSVNMTAQNTGSQGSANNASHAASMGRLRALMLNRPGMRLGLGTPLALTERLVLTSGTLVATGVNLLRLLNSNNDAVIGASRQSFIDGVLQRLLPPNLAFDPMRELSFPVGQGDIMPLSFIAPVSGTDTTIIQAEAFNAAPQGSIGLGISTLTPIGYWQTRVIRGSLRQTRVQLTPIFRPTERTNIARADAQGSVFNGIGISGTTTTAVTSVVISNSTLLNGIFTTGENEPPRITGFSPTSGTTGTLVRIVGANFSTEAIVRFGGVPAQQIRILSSTELEAIVSTGATGNIELSTESGTVNSAPRIFRYLLRPTIQSFTPTSAGTGARIIIRGTDFSAPAEVWAGTQPLKNIEVESDSVILATLGNGTSGKIRVRTQSGTAESAEEFAFEAPPILRSTRERVVSTGASVSILGENLLKTVSVSIGGEEATILSVAATSIRVRVPSGITVSPAVITVRTEFGTSSVTAEGQPLSVQISTPAVIADFSPKVGGRGTVVTVRGTGFAGVTSLTVAGTAATITLQNDTLVIGTIGLVRLVGKVVVDGSTGRAESRTDFAPPIPILSTVQPIAATQGTTVILRGEHLEAVTSVTLGGAQTTNYRIDSPTQISVIVPQNRQGSGVVEVRSLGGMAQARQIFTFVPTFPTQRSPRIDSFTPNGGGRGTTVTVRGVNLDSSLVAYVGGVPVEEVRAVSSTQALVRVGEGTTGKIEILTPYGITVSREVFTYFSPRQLDSLALLEIARIWAEETQNRSETLLGWQKAAAAGEPLERWSGIGVENGRLTVLAVTGATLGGVTLGNVTQERLLQAPLPDTLRQFGELRRLIVRGFALKGRVPAFITEFSALQELDLSDNELSGELPEGLFGLPSLQRINLARNRLTGRLRLGNDAQIREKSSTQTQSVSTELRELDLSGNRFTGEIPQEIALFPFVRRLSFAGNQLEGSLPETFARLSFLEVLDIADNRFTGLPDMTEMPRLQSVRVERNRLDFAALERNARLGSVLSYIPQDSLGEQGRRINIPLESRYVLNGRIGGGRNSYQWFRNGIEIQPSSLDSLWRIGFMRPQDAGQYVCRITSIRIPELTLTTHTITLVATTPLAPQETIALVNPPNETINVSTQATLRWQGLLPNADGNIRTVWYEVQVAADSSFQRLVLNGSTATTSMRLEGISELSVYFWRVRVANSGGAGVWSSVWRFITASGVADMSISLAPFPRTVIGDTSLQVIRITNQSSRSLFVEDARIIGNAENAFGRSEPFSTVTLRAEESVLIPIQFFPRLSSGVKTAQLEVRYRPEQLAMALTTGATLRGQAGALQTSISFPDTMLVGRRTVGALRVVNRARRVLTLTLQQNAANNPLRFADGVVSQLWKLGQNDTAVIAFSGIAEQTGRVVGALQFQGKDEAGELVPDSVSVLLERQARLVSTEDVIARFVLRAADNNLPPGSEVSLELALDSGNMERLFFAAKPDWRAMVEFDNNVLVPLAQGGARVLQRRDTTTRMTQIELRGRFANPRDRIIARLRCRVVAGDTNVTRLQLTAMTVENGSFDTSIFIEPAPEKTFTARISQAGGRRLIAPAARSVFANLITALSPNPTQNDVEITYTLPTSAETVLMLTDITGRILQSTSVKLLSEGIYTERLNLSGLPSGTYSVVLRVGEQIYSEKVIIKR